MSHVEPDERASINEFAMTQGKPASESLGTTGVKIELAEHFQPAKASETLEEQAARIRRTKVGCKGGVMAEGAHLETAQASVLDLWTEEDVRMIIADVPISDGPRAIATAHNAKLQECWQEHDDVMDALRVANETIKQLGARKQQLRAAPSSAKATESEQASEPWTPSMFRALLSYGANRAMSDEYVRDACDKINATLQPTQASEWECPECKTRYTANVGKCGDLKGCSRPMVVPVAAREGSSGNASTSPNEALTSRAAQAQVEKIPDSCLPNDEILRQLGYEKID